MADLVEVKRLLKQWEVVFYKEHSRKPTKADIDAAPEDIKETYMKYTKLKKSLTVVESKSPTKLTPAGNQTADTSPKAPVEDLYEAMDGSGSEVWGSQFDRKVVGPDSPTVIKTTKPDSKPAFLQNLGKKMFEQSLKLNKLQHGVKPDAKPWRKPDTPRPVKPFYVNDTGEEAKMSAEPKTSSEETATLDNVIESKPVNFGKLFHKAVSISKHKGQNMCEVDTNVYLNKYQTKSKSKQSCLPSGLSGLVKKYRQTLDMHQEDFEGDLTEDINDVNESESVNNNEDNGCGGHSWNVPVSKLIKDDEKEARKKIGAKNSDDKLKKNAGETNMVSVDQTSKTAENTCSLKSQNEKTKDTFHFDGSSEDDLPPKVRKKTVKPKKQSARLRNCDANLPVEDSGDNIDHGKRTELVARRTKRKLDEDNDKKREETTYADVADMGSDEDLEIMKKMATTKHAAKKRKLNPSAQLADDEGIVTASAPPRKQARAKPVSNDNFIKLNMKIKTYKRKGRHLTGPQYKRKMWKEKMQARSKSYGDACFKCGQSGHWANKCPGIQSKGHYEKEPVLEEDFPSMQEAAMMARGCGLQTFSTPSTKGKPSNETAVVGEETDNPVTMEVDDLDLDIQSGIVRSCPEPVTAPPAMKPLIQCGEGETLPVTPEFVLQGLRKFGFEKFRLGQEDAVMRILCGLSTLVVLSTGGGKSLCYQLPAYLYAQRSPCITLVISPLVSLMEDQVTGLPHGIRGVCLHTNMTASQRESVLEAVKSGKAQFLLVSPEAIAGGSMSLITSMSSLPPVAFVCIDEAHCLSEWSHNFRPSYLRLCKVLREKLGVQCFLGLTATATLSTASDVARHLAISDFRKATVRGSPIPSNLILSVSRDEDKDQALIGLLKGERFGNLESIIVYCTRRDQTDKVATIIRTCMNTGGPQEKVVTKGRGKQRPKLEWDAESYHAGLTAAQRKRVQNAFMSGKLRVVVATVAFGMGLDKSDVRGIIHYNMPKSFESYVQEIGRAGRDGQQADCHVFLDQEGKDLCELRRHTYSNTVDYRTLKKLVQKVFPSCRCRDVHERHNKAVLEAQMFDNDFEEENNPQEINACQPDGIKEASDAAMVTMSNSTRTGRVCPGHERALPIQQTVLDLDLKEEGISTLLCYLELHDSQWLENMSNVYATCKVQCYGGPNQLQAVAKKCPPVAVAIAMAKRAGTSFRDKNSVEFSVVDVSDTMGWDSGPVKKELKLLQWNFDSGGPKRTGVMIEFSDLAYHFRTPGDFSTEELDDILQFLHERVQRQEKSEIRNLSRLYKALKSVSHKNHWMSSDEADIAKNDKLKEILNEYFDQQGTNAGNDEDEEHVEEALPEFSHGQLVGDIRAFYNLYGHEHSLNGRAIARIFHGIASPCFPATTWGRVRRFWRCHLDVDFNILMKIATKELLSFR